MKTYKIALLTDAGPVTEIYKDSQPLDEFEAEMITKHGKFITLYSQEITT